MLNNSKHAKYQTKNFISQLLVNRFFLILGKIYQQIEVNNILDVGCGEGFVLKYLNSIKAIKSCSAIDIDPAEVTDAKNNIAFCNVQLSSIYNLPYPDSSFDLVICSEVLEHLDNPENALKEIHRVAKNYIFLSVPNEPIWRILNMCRFKYINKLGNTPGHINNWSSRQIIRIASQYFQVLKVKRPIPWTILFCKKTA